MIIFSLCLLLSLLGNEWTFGYEGSYLFWVYGISRVVPLLVLFPMAFLMGALKPGRHAVRGLAIIIFLLAMAALYVFHPMYAGEVSENYRLFRNALMMNSLAALCCFIGYRIGSFPRAAYQMLNTWAIFLTWLAIYVFIIRFSTLDKALFYLVPMWPVGLYLIFPLCWYLHKVLSSTRFHFWHFFAFVANALNIGVAFHKPIISSAIASCMVLILLAIRAKGFTRPIFRFLIISIFGAFGVYYANAYSRGLIAQMAGESFESKFLHQDQGPAPLTIWETIDRASGGRIQMWGDSLEKFCESPLIGHGPGQEYSSDAKGNRISETIPLHNVYIQQLVAMGLVGTVPMLIGLFLWFYRVSNKRALCAMDSILTPVVSAASGILFYCCIGTGDMFNTLIPFCITLMSISLSLVEHYAENYKTSIPAYNRTATGINQSLRPGIFPQLRKQQ